VFYRIDEAVPEEYRQYLLLNPLASLIAEFRQVLVEGATPDWGWLAYVCGFSSVFLIFGLLLLVKYDRYYPRLLVK
jgi:lipopolysaccharide transport system permease protein